MTEVQSNDRAQLQLSQDGRVNIRALSRLTSSRPVTLTVGQTGFRVDIMELQVCEASAAEVPPTSGGSVLLALPDLLQRVPSLFV